MNARVTPVRFAGHVSRVLLIALLFVCPLAEAAQCNTFPWYRLSVLHVPPGGTLVLEGHFDDEPSGRLFILRRAADVLSGDPAPGDQIDLRTQAWSAKQVQLGVPKYVEPAWYEIGVRCTDPRAAHPTLGFRGLVRLQGDPGSWRERLLLQLEDVPQMRSMWSDVLLAGFFGFVLLFTLPFVKAGLHARLTAANLTGAAWHFLLAWTFWTAWWNPSRLGEAMVTYLVFLMILEFLLMHSSILFGTYVMARDDSKERLKSILLLGSVYSVFALGVSVVAKSVWPFVLLWWVTLGRFLPVLLRGPGPGEQESHLRRAAPCAVFYLFGAFFCMFYPLPHLGMTSSLRGHGSGLWMDEPYRALAFGVFYFFLLGIAELTTQNQKPAEAAPAAVIGGADGNS